MIKESLLQYDFEKLWKEGMLDWHGRMPERMVDDELEEAFWMQSMKKKKYKQTDEYAKRIYEKMKKHIPEDSSCIEFGPGWGNYTFPLSRDVKRLTLVDGSKSVLAYLKQYFEEEAPIQFVHSKWEEAQLEPHDVVVGVNCFYRMYEMNETLKKMNRLAKKRAIIGLTTGPIQPHYVLLDEQFGYDIKYPRRDYIMIVNMLYQLGIYADCEMIKLEREHRYDTWQQLIDAGSKKILSPRFEQTHVGASLERFISREDGQFVYRYPFHAAIISWEPVKHI
ncbi:methyltransferase [Cytobacillus firmus]|uniref:class I SAM-dependent methyltransferase n=1 Tax=Cytobacillus firmus TaxID=1399 RepID=UPI00077C63DB|nr:class I SAM-dependent methyltransferase [Cytobacillus firmus]MBG9543178.1 methyltransferase [Cytobacillus firmus]MBG9549098.1 methyltransferase [Cytobacillus firmus]MBG9552481.1 methyltransferase [Cytobacillus firmus]MBG9558858.1 methyltransferase [Cytobacillus firmus]MBG9575440.1 methyltransferase [Cytobacillus firmus]